MNQKKECDNLANVVVNMVIIVLVINIVVEAVKMNLVLYNSFYHSSECGKGMGVHLVNAVVNMVNVVQVMNI